MNQLPRAVMLATLALSLSACQSATLHTPEPHSNTLKQYTPISYQEAQNYFVRNDISTPLPRKITSASQFARYFGEASTATAHPTPINFKHNYVIVLEQPVTSIETKLNVLSLQRSETQIILNYAILTGQRMSYQTHPCLLLIVPNTEQGQITLKAHHRHLPD